MPSISIRLSRTAAEKIRQPREIADLKQAAVAAYKAAGAGDIYFALFRSNGRQFALSSRTVIDVEWVPNRLPDRIIRPRDKPAVVKRGKRPAIRR